MKVINIEKSKKKNCFILIFDNGEKIEVFEDVVIDLKLLSNKNVDIRKLREKKEYYDIYNRVLGYISNRMRTKYEINAYLGKYTKNNELREDIINKLLLKNYVNDEEYVKRYINDRLNLSKDGPLKIKRNLLNLNIDSDIVDKYINKIDLKQMDKRLNDLICKYIKTHNKCSLYELKRKTLNYFINLGYDKEQIVSIIDNSKIETNDNIQKEYNRLYKKYKDKYKENIESYIKNRLFQKGYSEEEIEKIRI